MRKSKCTAILASGSPRRRELFGLLGLDFQVVPAEVEETPFPGEAAADYVLRMAVNKASWVHERQEEGQYEYCHTGREGSRLVLAADTTVVCEGRIMGKPGDEAEAEEMLRRLRGRTHQVFSGIAAGKNEKLITDLCVTDVPMRYYSDQEINVYVASKDPLDKAGAYAIQHAGFHPVENLRGCFANVMGLPLCHVARAFGKLGVGLSFDVPAACQKHIDYECPIFETML